WRNSVANLDVLRRTISQEDVVVGEGLKPRGLPDSQTPALGRIVVDVIMTVLRDVAHNGRCRPIADLNAETIGEIAAVLPRHLCARVLRQKFAGKIAEGRRAPPNLRKARSKEV